MTQVGDSLDDEEFDGQPDDAVLPDPEPVYDDDPRNGFYEGLAYDFETAERDVAPLPQPIPMLPIPEVAEPDIEPAPN